jgi:hypothetical protein
MQHARDIHGLLQIAHVNEWMSLLKGGSSGMCLAQARTLLWRPQNFNSGQHHSEVCSSRDLHTTHNPNLVIEGRTYTCAIFTVTFCAFTNSATLSTRASRVVPFTYLAATSNTLRQHWPAHSSLHTGKVCCWSRRGSEAAAAAAAATCRNTATWKGCGTHQAL